MTADTNASAISYQICLPVSLELAWYAVADARQFGTWIGLMSDTPFSPGASCTMEVVPTPVDAELRRLQEPDRGRRVKLIVEQIEPLRLLSLRWHPNPERGMDYSSEPMTQVVFRFEKLRDATQVTVNEHGFDVLAPERRTAALRAHERAWEYAIRSLRSYVAPAAGDRVF